MRIRILFVTTITCTKVLEAPSVSISSYRTFIPTYKCWLNVRIFQLNLFIVYNLIESKSIFSHIYKINNLHKSLCSYNKYFVNVNSYGLYVEEVLGRIIRRWILTLDYAPMDFHIWLYTSINYSYVELYVYKSNMRFNRRKMRINIQVCISAFSLNNAVNWGSTFGKCNEIFYIVIYY